MDAAAAKEYEQQLKKALAEFNKKYIEPLGRAAEQEIAAGANICARCGKTTLLLHPATFTWVCKDRAQYLFTKVGGGALDFTR